MTGQDTPAETYRAVHDWSENRALSTTVVLAVRRVLETPETELPPLYEHVDPDALDSLFASINSEQVRADGRLTFPYAGLLVAIEADGAIRLSTSGEEAGE
jgi:hypothetical protein